MVRARRLLALVLLVPWTPAGCSGGEAPKAGASGGTPADATPAKAPPVPAPPPKPVNVDTTPMGKHFDAADKLHLSVVDGDPEAIRAAAQSLAEHDAVPGVPQTWLPHLARIKASATRAATDGNVQTAAAAMGEIAAACGTCHRAHNVKPEVGQAPVPTREAAADSAATHMADHQIAVDQLWRGLISHDDDAWRAGAKSLADAKVCPTEVTQNAAMPKDARRLPETLHELAAQAGTATDLAARGTLYGSMLATCGSCHTSGC